MRTLLRCLLAFVLLAATGHAQESALYVNKSTGAITHPGTASTFRSANGLQIGVNIQAYDADLTTWAGITPSANVQTLLSAADYAAFRASLGLVIGTNVQAWDADLDDLADGSLSGSKVGSGIAAANVSSGQIGIANGGTGVASLSFVYATKNSDQTVADGSTDAVTYTEVTDPDGCWDGSTFTAPRGGKLLIVQTLMDDVTTPYVTSFAVYKNGSKIADYGSNVYAGKTASSALIPVTTADTVQIKYHNASGTSRTLYGYADSNYVSFYLLP